MHINDHMFRFHPSGPYTVVYEMVETRTGTDGKTYIRYLNYNGGWIIAQVDDSTVDGYDGQITLFKAGDKDVDAVWAAKELQEYVAYDKL